MKKRIYMFALAVFLLTMPVSANIESEPSRISIISNGEEHEPFSNFLHATVRSENGGYISATGLPPALVDRLFENLTEIQYANDFQIIIEGIYATSETILRYMLYNDKFECIFNDEKIENFTFPNDAGIYILKIEAIWEHDLEYSKTEHCFKINTGINISPMTGDNSIFIIFILLIGSSVLFKRIERLNNH